MANKIKNYVTFWLEQGVVDKARKTAKRLGYNLSAIVNILLEDWVEKKEEEE